MVVLLSMSKSVYLGNTIYSDISLKCIDVSDLFIRTNSLLHDFSNVDSNILSKLHNTYCMSIYGSQLGNLIVFRVSINFTLLGGRQSEGYGKLTLARITY